MRQQQPCASAVAKELLEAKTKQQEQVALTKLRTFAPALAKVTAAAGINLSGEQDATLRDLHMPLGLIHPDFGAGLNLTPRRVIPPAGASTPVPTPPAARSISFATPFEIVQQQGHGSASADGRFDASSRSDLAGAPTDFGALGVVLHVDPGLRHVSVIVRTTDTLQEEFTCRAHRFHRFSNSGTYRIAQRRIVPPTHQTQ